MKRSIPEHFKLDGKPKKGFESRQEALEEQIKVGAESVYECEFCGKYHLGTRKH